MTTSKKVRRGPWNRKRCATCPAFLTPSDGATCKRCTFKPFYRTWFRDMRGGPAHVVTYFRNSKGELIAKEGDAA